MRLIAFITHSVDIRQILDHVGIDSGPPRISPACEPPLWSDVDAQMDDGSQIEPDWDLVAQPAPDYEVDQRFSWSRSGTAIHTRWGGLRVSKAPNQLARSGFTIQGL